MECGLAVAPSVVGITNQLVTIGIVDPGDVAKHIGFKNKQIICTGRVCRVSILHSNGRAICIIKVNEQLIAPFFSENLRAIDRIEMVNTIDSLSNSDAIVIIRK